MAGDVKVAVVHGAISSSGTGTKDFIKTGFGSPKACIVILSFDPTDNTSVASQNRLSIGFSDFTNHRCVTHQEEDGSARVDCDALKSATKAYIVLDIGATVIIDGTASIVTDGVRLTNTTNSGSDAVFATVIMFGGADLKVSLDSITTPNSVDGTQGVTTGIDQDLVFFIGTDIAAEDSASSGVNNSFGVAHIDTSDHLTFVNRCLGWAIDHNNADGSAFTTMETDHCLKIIQEDGSDDWSIELTAADATSYTITEREFASGTGMEIYALALDLNDRGSKIGTVTSPASGTSWTPSVTLGFTPQCVGLGLQSNTAVNTIHTQAPVGISANTGSGEEACNTFYGNVGVATTEADNMFRSRAVYILSEGLSFVREDLSHSSFDSGGWTYTINEETLDTGWEWFYWAIEEAAAPAPPPETHGGMHVIFQGIGAFGVGALPQTLHTIEEGISA